jgi:hypothetical protein
VDRLALVYGTVLSGIALTLENVAVGVAALALLAAGVCLAIVNSRLNRLERAGQDLTRRLDSLEDRVPDLHPDA